MTTIDFEAIIKSALSDNQDGNDIAQQFTDALNRVTKEREASKTDKARKNELVRKSWNTLSNEVKNGYLKNGSVIAALTIDAGKTNPDWTFEHLQNYVHLMSIIMNTFESMDEEDLKGVLATMDALSDLDKTVKGILSGEVKTDPLEEFLKSLG